MQSERIASGIIKRDNETCFRQPIRRFKVANKGGGSHGRRADPLRLRLGIVITPATRETSPSDAGSGQEAAGASAPVRGGRTGRPHRSAAG